jgi:hypothetical protein
VLPNSITQHPRLSLTARGLLGSLLSMRDGSKATIDTITDRVPEGRRAVAKAFRELEAAGYLRRVREQAPETGLWTTQLHVSDLPIDHIPAAGEPQGRNVGDSPQGKTGEKNLPPETSEASPAEEGPTETPVGEHDEASDEGRAAACLARLRDHDRRLALGLKDILRLAPLAAHWLTQGHGEAQLLRALTARLPLTIDAPAALISYRLKNHMPAPVQPRTQTPPRTARCTECPAALPPGQPSGACANCTARSARGTSEEPALLSAEAAGLLSAIRERRRAGTTNRGPRHRLLPATSLATA